MDVIIVGAGGHAAELYEYIKYSNGLKGREKISIKGFMDDDRSMHAHYGFIEPYLGEIKSHQINSDVKYLMGIANLKYRKEIVQDMTSKGAEFVGFIHPLALIASTAKIDKTVVISHNASVGPMVNIGAHNILNSRCTIGHDTVIGSFNFVSPQVAVSGNTTIGNGNLLGTNSATIPGIVIGNDNVIGAGAVVIRNVPSGVVVVGNRARILGE